MRLRPDGALSEHAQDRIRLPRVVHTNLVRPILLGVHFLYRDLAAESRGENLVSETNPENRNLFIHRIHEQLPQSRQPLRPFDGVHRAAQHDDAPCTLLHPRHPIPEKPNNPKVCFKPLTKTVEGDLGARLNHSNHALNMDDVLVNLTYFIRPICVLASFSLNPSNYP